MKLRPANEGDGEAIRKLVFGILAEFRLRPDPEGTDADLKNVVVSYQNPGGLFGVLTDEDGTIVGTVGVFAVSNDRCELQKMYLASRVRKQGHGRRLLEHALHEATARGFRRIELETAFALPDAIALYESYGFLRFEPEHMISRCDCAYYLDLR